MPFHFVSFECTIWTENHTHLQHWLYRSHLQQHLEQHLPSAKKKHTHWALDFASLYISLQFDVFSFGKREKKTKQQQQQQQKQQQQQQQKRKKEKEKMQQIQQTLSRNAEIY